MFKMKNIFSLVVLASFILFSSQSLSAQSLKQNQDRPEVLANNELQILTNELDLNDIYKISEDNQGAKNMHGAVLESKQQLSINYQLMNIRTPNISDESKEDIINSLNEEIIPLNVGGFVMLYEADGLRNSIGNTHTWLAETFGSLILR